MIIGGGPGGYVAAVRAAQLGLRTAVAERAHLGGICLNWGCIPTKALLRSAEIYGYLSHADRFGLTAEKIGFDAAAVVERSRKVAGQLSKGVDGILKKNKVPVIWGEATITAPGRIAVKGSDAPAPRGVLGGGEYTAKHVIVATGARPRVVPGLEPDGDRIWTYFEAMVPKEMPKSLIVVGSGAIGTEFASFYRTMGAEVTIVELLPQILPVEDEEVSKLVRKQFEKQGIRILTSAKVSGVTKGADGVTATIDLGDGKSETITAERMISAVGVVGNVEGIGLEALGVKIERGVIVTDGLGRTSIPGIYAIGDVAGPPLLAHKAEHEGILCVEAIAGLDPHPLDRSKIPGCTYCSPQVASVGLTEAKARESGREIRVGKFPFVGNGKAVALGEPDGFVKTIFDAGTGQLLGAHLVGPEVTELIQGFVIAMNLETTEEELIHAVFPHPTLSEAMHESVLAAYGRVIHI
ncbi:MAG: dihydrolipoyl dehydrogenase [Bauldia sp.]